MAPRARAPQARPGGKQGGLGFKSVKAVASSAKGTKGAPSASAGATSAKRAAQFGKGGKAARADAAPAPPVLQWDKHAMMALLNAVRAESFGEVTLNPSQDDGYLARLVARVRTASFAPTDAQVCLKLFEWRASYGDSQEAFEKCEMSVQRSEAAKRHEKIWASQDVSRSSVGEHSSQVKRVARASYAVPPSPTKRMSAFASSGSPTTPQHRHTRRRGGRLRRAARVVLPRPQPDPAIKPGLSGSRIRVEQLAQTLLSRVARACRRGSSASALSRAFCCTSFRPQPICAYCRRSHPGPRPAACLSGLSAWNMDVQLRARFAVK